MGRRRKAARRWERFTGSNGALALQHCLDLLLLVVGQVGQLEGDSLDADVRAHHVPEDAVRVEGRVQVLHAEGAGPQPPFVALAAHDELLPPACRAVLVHWPPPVHLGLVPERDADGHGVVHPPQPDRQVAEVGGRAPAVGAAVVVPEEVGLAPPTREEVLHEGLHEEHGLPDPRGFGDLVAIREALVAQQGSPAEPAGGHGRERDVHERPHDAGAPAAREVPLLLAGLLCDLGQALQGVWDARVPRPRLKELTERVRLREWPLLPEHLRELSELAPLDGEVAREVPGAVDRGLMPGLAVALVQEGDEAAQGIEPPLPRDPGRDPGGARLVVPEPARSAGGRARVWNHPVGEVGPLVERLRMDRPDASAGGDPFGNSTRRKEWVLRTPPDVRLDVAAAASQQLHERRPLRALEAPQEALGTVRQAADGLLVGVRRRAFPWWAEQERGVVHGTADDLQEEARLRVRPHVTVQRLYPQRGVTVEGPSHIGDYRHGVPAVRAHVVVELQEVPAPAVLRIPQCRAQGAAGGHAHDATRGVEGERGLLRAWHQDGVPVGSRLPGHRRQCRQLCVGGANGCQVSAGDDGPHCPGEGMGARPWHRPNLRFCERGP
mmetsp:Transcript_99243/g.309604  ORF Transcript_99243/g.309604 Transcript_99243/m.309604 type:complete len:608 (-) Transcript_99243:17-1840(-)